MAFPPAIEVHRYGRAFADRDLLRHHLREVPLALGCGQDHPTADLDIRRELCLVPKHAPVGRIGDRRQQHA